MQGGGEGPMKHYRINKLARIDGPIAKRKDILASDDREAMRVVRDDPECPVCDVYRDGQKVGSIA
jgi:hypothetical protein